MSLAPNPLKITYYDPDYVAGSKTANDHVWDLSDRTMANGYVCSAIAGIEGLPVMMQEIPLLDGTAIPNIYIPQTGTIGLAILVARPASDNENDYYTLLDRIVRAFYNRRNEAPKPGLLKIKRPSGTTRQIYTYTTSGFNTPDVGVNDMTVYSFALSTPDPFWSGEDVTSIPFAFTNYTGILPVLPVQLNAAHSLGGPITITINGDMPSYPTWIIDGPGTPTVKNVTNNRAWALNKAVSNGQRVQVNTARGHQAVFDANTKANLWSELVFSGPRDLWPLTAGDNIVTISIPDATLSTVVTLEYWDKWARA
jgi:hypothetical protein